MLNPTPPRTWVTGETVTATLLNNEIRDRAIIVAEHVLVQVVTASTASATIDLVQIPQGYQGLRADFLGRSEAAGTQTTLVAQFSAGTSTAPSFDTAGNYDYCVYNIGGISPTRLTVAGASADEVGYLLGSGAPTHAASDISWTLTGYAGTVWQKSSKTAGAHRSSASTGDYISEVTVSDWKSTSPINAIRFMPGSGNFSSGCVLTVYGRRTTATSS